MTRTPWTLEEILSPARMAPYMAARAGAWEAAVALYDWNTTVGAAFFESLHYLEVGLRNAVDDTACELLGTGWLTGDSTRLSPRARQAVTTASRHAGGAGAPRGKIIAELPFGFWWSLMSDENNRRLWQPVLQHAFEGPVRRRRLHAEFDELRRLRNRIAHHEPIHARDLDADFARLLDIAERVAASLGQHIARTSRVPSLLAARE